MSTNKNFGYINIPIVRITRNHIGSVFSQNQILLTILQSATKNFNYERSPPRNYSEVTTGIGPLCIDKDFIVSFLPSILARAEQFP